MRTYDDALELRDIAGGAVAASGQTTPVVVDVAHAGAFAVYLYITAIAGVGTETYSMAVEVDDAASTGFVPIATLAIPRTTPAGSTIPIECHSTVAQIVRPNANKIRVNATLGGTGPSITYGAWMGPIARGNRGRAADRL